MTLVARAVPFAAISCLLASSALGADRRIEEVVVTAEKREATVSDTSISITAFGEQAIEDFGLQGADDMVNYIPATTRDAYDIRIRGVGRNFRALGGDPGVATYYNGIYSPDFGIAASENALYDVARIEVLRGPQGTLYGRNSIGGALNYITNDPSMTWTGNVRAQFGDYDDQEFYGVLSGPIIQDRLAFRAVGVKRDRDGTTFGTEGTPDADSVDDSNFSLGLLWNVTDNLTVELRGNDRFSDRTISSSVVISEGPGPIRGQIAPNAYAQGLREVGANDPGALAFTDPRDGSTVHGAYVRPGVDAAASHQPNPKFGHPGFQSLMGGTKDEPNRLVSLNSNGPGESCRFPYTTADCHHELFDHHASQNEITWDVNENLTVKYLFGTNDFIYTFNVDTDLVNSEVSKLRQTVTEDVQSKSHELQFLFNVGPNIEVTSGLYYFDEIRKQNYSLSNSIAKYIQPANYGNLDDPVAFLGGASILQLAQLGGPPARLGEAPVGTQVFGVWGGDPRGDWYHHTNTHFTEAVAVFTQATWDINEKFSLVLGARWAEDDKEAEEIREFYFELGEDLAFANDFLPFMPGTAGLSVGPTTGLTTIALQNIAMGNATYSGDPDNPLTPTCDLGNSSCSRGLRLQGIPFSGTQTTVGSDDWGDTNFRVNLDWKPNENILMYFSVTTGYRSGGYSLGVTDARNTDENGLLLPSTYDQEEVSAFEVGYKGTHLNGTLQLNASLYTYDYEDYQDRVDTFDPIRQSQVDVVENADSARNSGFEVEWTWLPTDSWTIGGNYSFTKAEYTSDYFVAVNDNPDLPASLFGNTEDAPELFLVNANGNQLKRIPEHKATLWGQYNVPLPNGSDLTFGSTYSYTGEYYDEGFEKEIDRIPSRFRLDLTATWMDPSRRWEVRAFARNVTNETNIRGVGSATESSNWLLSGAVLEPRFIGMDVTYNFGSL